MMECGSGMAICARSVYNRKKEKVERRYEFFITLDEEYACKEDPDSLSERYGGVRVEGRMIAFIIVCVLGGMFLYLAVRTWSAKSPRPMGFWANAEMFEVSDVEKYNLAMAKLFGAFGTGLIVLGLPLLAGQNTAWAVLFIVGVMIESITAMVVYVLVIEKRYRKRG